VSELAVDETLPPDDEPLLADVVSEFARTMPPDSSVQAIIDHLVERIIEILPISSAGVTLLPRSSEHRYVAASDASALGYELLQRKLHEGPGVLTAASGEAVQAPDLSCDERFPTFGPRALRTGLSAVFTFPLRHAGHRLGALDLYLDAAGPMTPKAMGTAQTVADVVTAQLINARAREHPRERFDDIKQSALRDELTGLPNRILLLDRLALALLRSQGSGRSSAVIWLDLDLTGQTGRSHSPAAGDEVLAAIAVRLRGLLRRTDTLARLADNAFGVLCEDLQSPAQADAIAARLTAALTRPFQPADPGQRATASVGIAWMDADQYQHGPRYLPEELLRSASQARASTGNAPRQFGVAQRGGEDRDRVNLDGANRGRDDGGRDNRDRDERGQPVTAGLADDLTDAQSRGEFHVEYQPILLTVSNRITGFEALLRWIHPTRGLIPPATFIPWAEKSGLINQIGGWVLAQACADRARLQAEHPGEVLDMAVNVSVHQLMSPGFTASVAAVLAGTDADPRRLILEITESVFIRDGERALIVLSELNELGVQLALDDFGTGYSSLSYLKRFPVQILKIDRAFIVDLVRDAASHSIVSAIVNLAHDLDMTVVAEGVETAEQHEAVRWLGCDSYQGFYFARPSRAPGNPGQPARTHRPIPAQRTHRSATF
jgi:diguanylate cyclase (GGDEF)-like protein